MSSQPSIFGKKAINIGKKCSLSLAKGNKYAMVTVAYQVQEEDMHRRILLVSALILISISFGVTAAQGGVLTPGGGQLASLTEQTPLSIFNFSGNEGDLATVRVQGLTPGMSVSLSLLSPSQDSLGSNNDAPHAGASGSTSVSARLPRAGTYTALVGGTPGDYVISLDLFTPPAAQPLGTDAPATASLFAESPIHEHSFNA